GLTIQNGGRVTVAPGAAAFNAATLSIQSTGALDLNDNDLIVTTGNFIDIRALVFAGYSSTPNGTKTGIISTAGQNAGNTILALVDNMLLGLTSWDDIAISPNAILGKYTYFGDVDLDGQVTPGDYGVLDANLGTTPAPGIAILTGDAAFDGQVTPGDYGILDANLASGSAN